MARVEISEIVFERDLTGNSRRVLVGSGFSVQVNERDGGAATVYQDATGGATHTNPLTADSGGRINGWVEEGSYDLVVNGDDDNPQRYEAVAGASLVAVESGHEVNIRDFMLDGLSPNGGSGTNSTTAINNAIQAASDLCTARGLREVGLKGFGQATYMIDDLKARKNVKLLLDEARLIRKSDIGNPMIRTQNPGTAGDSYAAFGGSFKIIGGTFDTNGFGSSSGNAIQLWFVSGLELDGVTVLLNQASNPKTAICVGGRNGKVTNCNVLGGTQIFEGGIWVIHGQYWALSDNYVEGGDDCYIVENLPSSAQMLANPDPLRYITLSNNTGKSERAYLLRLLVDASEGAVSSPNWEITDIAVNGLVGTAGRLANGGIRIEDESAGITQLVKRVDVSGLELAVGSTGHDDAALSYGVVVDNCYDVSVQGNVEITQKTAAANGFGLARVTDSDDVTLDLNCNALQRLQAYDLDTSARVKLRGRVRATSALAFGVVRLKDTPDVDIDMAILDVPDGKNAITEGAGATTNSGRISGGRVAHAAGATTGRAIQFAAGSFTKFTVSEAFDFDSPQVPELAADRIVPSPRLSVVRLYDDFLGDLLADEWGNLQGTDPQAVAPAIAAETGGVVVVQPGDDAAGTMAVNGALLHSGLNWRRSKGGLFVEINACLSGGAITNMALFLGFTDQIAALEMPFTLAAGDALTSNATDAVGVLYDTAADTDNWWAVGVATDVDATKQNLGVAPVLNTYERFRVEIATAGAATFFRNGTRIGTAMSGAVGNVDLTPVVAVLQRNTGTRSVKVDLIRCEQYR